VSGVLTTKLANREDLTQLAWWHTLAMLSAELLILATRVTSRRDVPGVMTATLASMPLQVTVSLLIHVLPQLHADSMEVLSLEECFWLSE